MRGGTEHALGLCALAVVIGPSTSVLAQSGDEPKQVQADAAQGPVDEAEPATVLPGEAHGIAVDESHPEHELLWIPRILLAPLRFAILVGTEPIYQLARLEDEYEIQQRAIELFFNDEQTFGWYPTAFFETGFGVNVGARVVHRDLFGDNESLMLRAAYGRVWRQSYGYSLGSGNRFGDFEVGLDVDYRRKPRRRFFGFGPEDEVQPEDAALPLDARTADVAVRSHYRIEEARGGLTAEGGLGQGDRWTMRLTHQWRWRRFETGRPKLAEQPDEAWLDEIYVPETVVGFLGESWDNYNELRLTFDGRVSSHPDLPRTVPSEGWKVDGWTGWHLEPGEARSYARLGLDVQPYVDLYNGDRVLRFRFRVTSVVGRISEVPFVDQPSLGGSLLLRGYPRDRFRGRAAALTQIEYRYPIQPILSGYLFVDAGRVWASGEGASIDDFQDVRVGFGAGLLLYTGAAFVAGAQLSTSIDGGVFVRLNLNTTDGLVETH